MLLRLNSTCQAQPTSLGGPKYPRSNSAPFSLLCSLGQGDAPEHRTLQLMESLVLWGHEPLPAEGFPSIHWQPSRALPTPMSCISSSFPWLQARRLQWTLGRVTHWGPSCIKFIFPEERAEWGDGEWLHKWLTVSEFTDRFAKARLKPMLFLAMSVWNCCPYWSHSE